MLVSISKASKLSGRSIYSIRDYTYRNGLPVQRGGSFPDHWYVDTDDLLKVLQQQRHNLENKPYRPGPGRGHRGESAGPLQYRENENH